MHLRVDIDPQQLALRSEREPASGVRGGTAITCVTSPTAVMVAAVDPLSVAVPLRLPLRKSFGTSAFINPVCSGQHPRMKIARGKDSLRQSHRSVAMRWLRPESLSSTTTRRSRAASARHRQLRAAGQRHRSRECHCRERAVSEFVSRDSRSASSRSDKRECRDDCVDVAGDVRMRDRHIHVVSEKTL